MPTISFASPKGGAGKTTAATLCASELALRGRRVTLIDADPNHTVMDWAALAPLPAGLEARADISEETIATTIAEAARVCDIVIVDLEGAASLLASYAVAMSDLVVIPVQGSQLDARQAARQIRLIEAQQAILDRPIRHAVLFTRTNPALAPKTARFIEQRFRDLAIPVLATPLVDREAYRALFSFGGTLADLASHGVRNLEPATANVRAIVDDLLALLEQRASTVRPRAIA